MRRMTKLNRMKMICSKQSAKESWHSKALIQALSRGTSSGVKEKKVRRARFDIANNTNQFWRV